jgi:hypothetical protein
MVLFSAACGGGSADSNADAPLGDTTAASGTPGDLTACAALPPEDVQAVIGTAVRDSLALQLQVGQGGGPLSQCNYASSDNPAIVSLMLNHSPGAQFTSVAQDGVRGTLTESGVTVEDVAGLGQVAFWGGGQLHVFANPTWYFIVTAPERQQAQELAQRVLPRLN